MLGLTLVGKLLVSTFPPFPALLVTPHPNFSSSQATLRDVDA